MKVAVVILCVVAVVVATLALGPWFIDNIRYDDFVVAGTVVDETGQPLDDVRLKITAGRRIKMGFESKNDSRYDKVNGTFQYEFNNYSIISILFLKEGYQYQELSWTRGGEHRGIRVVMKKGSGPASRPIAPLPFPAAGQPTSSRQ